ncbi:MAG: G5 domain-containing protein, partial [Oscillospiraceae bacterium]|nr:G5 domain-containing protein [Oscillospiraceae bacterium]
IMAEQAENYVTVTIVGTKENNHSVFIERVQVSHTPAEAIEQVNPELPPGKSMVVQDAYDGWTVETYRVVLDGEGNEISRIREAVSRYRKVDKITEVGPPEPPPTPEPPPPDPEPPPEPPDSEPPSDGPVEDTPGPPDAEPMPQPGPMPADPDGDGGDGEPIAPPIGEL